MRLKLTVVRRGEPDCDVLVVTDATTTIGEVAVVLAGGGGGDAEGAGFADGPDSGDAAASRLTLRVLHPGSRRAHLLDPGTQVGGSDLCSGCRVEAVRADDRRADDVLDAAAALVRVIAGPHTGRTFRLARGTNLVGRDTSAAVRLSADGEVSRRHATITIDGRMSVTDLNSANGVHVDGALVRNAAVNRETSIQVGGTVLRVEPLAEHRAARAPAEFVRSPRVEQWYRPKESVVPELPVFAEKARLPVLMLLAPVLMGAALLAVSRQPTALVFVALSPLIMVATWLDGRLRRRRAQRRARADFDDGMRQVRAELGEESALEREARMREAPATSEIVQAIESRSALLWTRTPEQPGFLDVRFGTGARRRRSRIRSPGKNGGTVDDRAAVRALEEEFESVSPVPVTERLARAGSIGIAGRGMLADDAVRALLVQLAGLHSPAEVTLAAFVGPRSRAAWAWLAWLPHTDFAHSPLAVRGLTWEEHGADALATSLETLIADRRRRCPGPVRARTRLDGPADPEPEAFAPTALPVVVVLVTEDAPVKRARLVALAHDGPDLGVFVLWLATAVELLPITCRTHVMLDALTGTGAVGYVRNGEVVPLETIEVLDSVSAESAARALAPVTDTGARSLDHRDLPGRVSFPELYGDDLLADPSAIVRRWRKNGSLVAEWRGEGRRRPGELRAVVGQGMDGPFALDLRAQGPHALVGGTTGAGKSEFLQSWIMAMAIEYSPDRLTFLLVDYKGGAAFADCVSLPHTVGLVTDLSPRLVRRALRSLRAELQHRERVLSSHGAKDLAELEERGDADAPPMLVIVVDEFAALAAEMPEFVDGIVDVAQRGRSLGLHLVLATQRPSGVIRDSLRANTNLRIALRVADETDSTDVLGSPAAARFDPATPGRAAAAFGAGRLSDFQSAYLGGFTPPGPSRQSIQVCGLPLSDGMLWPDSTRPEGDGDGIPDIARLARLIASAADHCAIDLPRRPWLDALQPDLELLSLPTGGAAGPAIGILDQPEEQSQRPLVVDLDAVGNVAIVGAGGSGKSAVLRAVAVAAARDAVAHPVVVHAIDFAGGALRMLERLPTTSAVVLADEGERLTRMLAAVTREVEERAALFAANEASGLGAYRAATGAPLPRILVLLDGFGAFRAEHEFRPGGAFDRLLSIASLGRQLGVHLVVTTDRAGALPPALAPTIGEQITLRLAGESEYAVTGVRADIFVDAPPGRAVVRGMECQIAVPSGSRELVAQAAAVDRLGADLRADGVISAVRVECLPELIPIDELPPLVRGRPTLGVAFDTVKPVGLPLGALFVVTGPFGSGRTTAMRMAVQAARSVAPRNPAFLISTRAGPLHGATAWTAASDDTASAAQLASRLAAELDPGGGSSDQLPLIVVEGVGEFEGSPAEREVVGLMRAARRVGATVLIEADAVTAPGAWQLFAELKTARAGIVLQPEEGDGASIFRVPFPRISRADFSAGRGILVENGRALHVQVAFPSGSAPSDSTQQGVSL